MDKSYQTRTSDIDTVKAGAVLFAVDDITAREQGEMMRRLGYEDALIYSGGCLAATKWAAEKRTDVLIVDLDEEPAPLQAVGELMDRCDPTCHIIAIGSLDDVDLYRALLRTGVFDYLKKPVQLDVLAGSLERAKGEDNGDFARLGRSVAVVGCSGGSGTSTVVAGLGILLSDVRRVPVGIVDFDRRKAEQGLLLGVSGDAGLEATLSNRELDLRLLQRSMIGVNPRLQLLAQEHPAEADEADSSHLLHLGATLCQLFKQVVWDLPSGLPNGALDILRHSEVRVLLTDLTVQGARNAQRLLSEVGDETDGQQLLLVRNPVRGDHATISKEQFEEFVKRRFDLSLPYAGNIFDDSLLKGPINLSGHSAFRQELLNLADLIRGRRVENAPKRGRFGILSRRFRRLRSYRGAA